MFDLGVWPPVRPQQPIYDALVARAFGIYRVQNFGVTEVPKIDDSNAGGAVLTTYLANEKVCQLKNQIINVLEDREQRLNMLRDVVHGYAERLVEEHLTHLKAIQRGGVITKFRPRVDADGCWGFRLNWWAVRLKKSGEKWLARSTYLRLNTDGTIDPRRFSQIIPEERVFLEQYEPEYVKIRQFMARLTTQRRMETELLKYVKRIEGIDQWVLHLSPGELPDW